MRYRLRDLLVRAPTGDIRLNAYWFSRLKEKNDNVFMTVEIYFGNGESLRMATEPLTITKKDGTTVGYEPALMVEPKISKSYKATGRGGSASQRSFALEIDARRIDGLRMVLSGSFIGGVAEIALQSEDTVYEDRFIIMVGENVGGVSFGVTEEPLKISISDPKLSVDRIIPAVMLSSERVSTLPESNEGKRYPMILTQFGTVPCIKLDGSTVNPDYLVAGGQDITVSRVWVDGEEATADHLDFGFTLYTKNDRMGFPYTYLSFKPSMYNSAEQKYNYEWADSSEVYAEATSDGLVDSTVPSIVRWVLLNATDYGVEGIDEVLFARTTAKAPAFHASVCINGEDDATASAIGWLTSTLLASFPMFSMAYTGRGMGLIFTDRRAALKIAHLVRGQALLFDRVSAVVETPTSELVNSVVLQYDYDARTDNYKRSVSRDSSSSQLCAISESRIGKREIEPIQSIVISDDRTAASVIDWIIGHKSLPSYIVSYSGHSSLFFLLQLGDNVSLSDDQLGFNNVSATVEQISYERSYVVVTLRLWLLYDSLADAI